MECHHFDPYPSEGYGALMALSTNLRRLTLFGCAVPPSCLSQLTALESLELLGMHSAMSWEDRQLLRAALPHLQQLTHLDIADDRVSAFPDADDQAAFASCPRLVSFHFFVPGPMARPLSGPWVGRLRSLAAPLTAVAGSLPELSTATQLRELQVQGFDLDAAMDDPAALLPALADWAVQRPSLRRLALLDNSVGPALRAQLLQVLSRRPSLSVSFVS